MARHRVTHDAGRIAWASEVDKALRTLNFDEQSFIRLSYFAGEDQERIAENAGVPLAFVSQAIASGMRRLGGALELSPAPHQSPTDLAAHGPELGLGA